MKSIGFITLFTCFLVLSLSGCENADEPDTLFINGNIVTMDSDASLFEAIAIKDDKILSLGSSNELMARATSNTRIIDLNGDTLIPGFVGVHEHPTLEAVFANTIDVSGFTHANADQMWQHLSSQIENYEKGDWIFAMGIDPILFPDLTLPTFKELDGIAPENPLVLISQTMHSFWANSVAFSELGITASTPDPGHGSYYHKDANGNLTGFISEAEAAAPFLEELKSPLSITGKYEDVLKGYLASGYTTVASLGFNAPTWLARYAALENFNPQIRQFYYLKTDELGMLPDNVDNGDDFFAVLGIKLWHDGSPYTGSMKLKAPYNNSALTKALGLPENHLGSSRLAPETFSALLSEFSQQGWQLAIHSQGDLSTIEVIKAMDTLQNPEKQNQRHRIEHGMLLNERNLEKMSALGMTPSFHINHIYYYGDALENGLIGEHRAQIMLPVRSAFELDMYPTLHADGPMFPTEPFHLMQTAILRKSSSGKQFGAHQAISRHQALQTLTYNGAWQLHKESQFGSLEPGKFADLVRLSANPLKLTAEKWREIQVLETWVAGTQRYPFH